MRKKFALLFVTVCAVMLSGCTLTGMTDVEKMYDDTESNKRPYSLCCYRLGRG